MNRGVGLQWMWVALGVICVTAVVLVSVYERGTPGSLLPHGYCFTWNPTLLWTHVVSDSLIGAAYVSIPLTLVHLVRRRTDLPFNWIVVLFALFIVSCGATHWIEVWTVWHPDYWLAGNVKVVTAVASVLTAGALVRLVPKILSIPTVSQLVQAKAALEVEISSRRQAEQALLRERSVLEERVLERTEALARAVVRAESAHAAAEEANQLKDRFLAKVSHELRTPLQSTLSWSQVLQRPGLDPARVAGAAERIRHNVRSQARLIDDLLDISRIMSGKLRLDLQQADAGEVIDRAVEVVRSSLTARDITIVVRRDVGPRQKIWTDPVRLEQLVWNLINNAVQASARGGRVEVSYEVFGSTLRIAVRDWGKGIEPSELSHIFEPFRQGPRNDNSHRGLGLGLAITRSIVDLFGGELDAYSAGAGQGATFTFELPLDERSLPDAPAGAGYLAEEQQVLAGSSILYVEDDPDIAEGVRLMLSDLGAQVRLCLSFKAAQDGIAAGGFDILLSDLNLGDGHTALDLIKILRASSSVNAPPAIVLSAYGSAGDKEISLRAGFSAHLVKPVIAADIARAILDAMSSQKERVDIGQQRT